MFLYKYGLIFRLFFPGMLWKVKTSKKVIYLTFDDGPIPEATEFILKELSKFNAKATFFCVGSNIKKNSLTFTKIIDAGHSVGNHSYDHLKGTTSSNQDYLKNIDDCQKVISDYSSTKLFRPPYGKMKRRQRKKLSGKYKIIMWDVLSGDFLPSMTPELCLKKLKKYTTKGSIVVFHDNMKTFSIIQEVLPIYLSFFTKKGYEFHSL